MSPTAHTFRVGAINTMIQPARLSTNPADRTVRSSLRGIHVPGATAWAWRLAGVLQETGAHVRVFDPTACSETPQRVHWSASCCPVRVGRHRRFHHGHDASFRSGACASREDGSHPRRCSSRAAWRRRSGRSSCSSSDPSISSSWGEGSARCASCSHGSGEGRPLRRASPEPPSARAMGASCEFPSARSITTSCARQSSPHRMKKCPMPLTGIGSKRRIRVGALPTKAAREARLAEIRSVRLITLNYCPDGLHVLFGYELPARGAGRRGADCARSTRTRRCR